MNGFYRNNKFYAVPFALDLLQLQELKDIFKIRVADIPTHEKVELATQLLYSIKWNYSFKTRPPFKVSHDEFVDFCLHGRLLLSDPILTKSTLSSFRKGWRKYFSPSNCMDNISFGEWIKLEQFLHSWQDSGEVCWKHKIMAVLYRPKKNLLIRMLEWLGVGGYEQSDDIRQQYNDASLERRAATMAKLPEHIQQLIITYFFSCRKLIIDNYKKSIFTKASDQETDNQNKSWYPVLNDLSQQYKVFPEEVGKQRLTTVFFMLSELIEKNKKQQEAIDQIKSKAS